MKITLKKVKTFIGREGHGLNADVYVDGVKTFFVRDDASGSVFYDHDVYNKEKYAELEKYVDSLPEYPLEIEGVPYEKDGAVVMMKPTIDHLVDEAFEETILEKERKRIEIFMLKKVMWGTEKKYLEISWQGYPIEKLLQTKGGPEAIRKAIERLAAEYPDGRLLNTNIPQSIYKP